jgi:hypothetical protein
MQWEADVSIAGPVGSMGQRVLQPIVNQQVGNVLNALEVQVEEPGGGDPLAAGAAHAGTAVRATRRGRPALRAEHDVTPEPTRR